MDYEALISSLKTLVLFRRLLKDRVFAKYMRLLETLQQGSADTAEHYAAFASALFVHTTDFSEYILNFILSDKNAYYKSRAKNERPDAQLKKCLAHELKTLEEASGIKCLQIKRQLSGATFLPEWKTGNIDFEKQYEHCMKNLEKDGFGVFRNHRFFTVQRGKLIPAHNPDTILLTDLSGYLGERALLMQNTQALLEGKPAANALLYGDSGTGKSSTIKAIANALAAAGIRLVEISKNELPHLPSIMRQLSENPLKFIIFIDDLSFAPDDDGFNALKAMLEGTVISRAKNTVIYATSNRRHLVSESFQSRQGDDIHLNETLQQTVSLSERFGLRIAFVTPGKKEYLDIVRHIADIYDIQTEDGLLSKKAEAFALEKGGRSGRVARQFIEQLIALGKYS